jgi:hypothetical protein
MTTTMCLSGAGRLRPIRGIPSTPWARLLLAALMLWQTVDVQSQTGATLSTRSTPTGDLPRTYFYGTDTIQKIGNTLVSSLKPNRQVPFTPEPVVFISEPGVFLRSQHRGDKHVIRISTNLVDLWQKLSHAIALNDVEPGFSRRYINSMRGPDGPASNLILPPIEHPQAWTLNVLNQQAGYFRAMAGGFVAAEIVYHRDGVCEKYPRALAANGGPPPAMASVVTAAQWRRAVREGARLGINAGIDPDGLGNLFLVLAPPNLPRPAWVSEMIPPDTDVRGARSDLNDIEMYNNLRH